MTTRFTYALGDTLRKVRNEQQATLRQISAKGYTSLGHLSEVEQGIKEPSHQMLLAICTALNVEVWEVLQMVSDQLRQESINHTGGNK